MSEQQRIDAMHKYLAKTYGYTGPLPGYAVKYLQKCRREDEIAAAVMDLQKVKHAPGWASTR